MGKYGNIIKRTLALLQIPVIMLALVTGCAGTSDNSAAGSTGETASEYASDDESVQSQTADTGDYEVQDGVDYSRLLAKSNQEFNYEDARISAVKDQAAAASLPADPKDYTVMVYMIGSNLESKLGKATNDLLEMEEAGLDYGKNNLLVYTGGAKRWSSDVPSDRNSVLDMSRESENRIVAQTDGNADMGAAVTLAEFVNFCSKNYPARHYALIFWDHGGGPLWGFGSDELYDSDSLTLSEMQEAMLETDFHYDGSGRKLDWVGFDACLMGSVENMYLWREFADYYVGSEELEPGDGWDYHFLSVLNEETEAKTVTGAIIDSYGAYYESIQSDSYNPDVTLSCADLGKVEAVAEAVGNFSAYLSDELDGGGYADIQKMIGEVKSCGLIEDTKGGGDYSYDLIDLGNLAQSEDVKSARALQEAVSEMIVSQYSNVEGTNGVTMYYPHANKGQYSKMQYEYSKVSIADEYSSYLSGVTDRWESAGSQNWVLGNLNAPDENSDMITYALNDDQIENVAAAYYTVFLDRGDDTYFTALRDVRANITKDGVVEIPADPKVICVESDTGSENIWPFYQVESKKKRSVYKNSSGRMVNHIFMEYDINHTTWQSVSIALSVQEDTGEVSIQTINAADNETVESSGKNSVDTAGWEGIYFTFHSLNPARDREGTILPSREWTSDSGYSFVTTPLDQKFNFKNLPISEIQENDYSIQLVLEDVSGERYATELYDVDMEKDFELYIEDTENGKITYHVYEDHAEAAEYNGSDTELTLPETVNGKPLTIIRSGAFCKIMIGSYYGRNPFTSIILPDTIKEIGDNAFRYCTDLTAVRMPASLESIGSCAFAECLKLADVEIPDTVKTIGKGAFAYCEELEEVILPPRLEEAGEGVFMCCENLKSLTMDPAEGAAYTVTDHMLLSADGTTLLAYACGRGNPVEIPEGVTAVTYGAFSYSSVPRVNFPETLKDIDNFAFFHCVNLQVPQLPDSLETIGTYAFGAEGYAVDMENVPDMQEELHIGPNVSSIGKCAFDKFVYRRFTVDDSNRFLSEVNGSVCNKSGDYVICLAASFDGTNFVLQVPEGVIHLDMDTLEIIHTYGWFDNTYGLSDNMDAELVVPSSVITLDNTYTFSYAYRIKRLHCAAGSAAEQFAQDNSIELDYETSVEYEEYRERTKYGEITYRLYEDHATLTAYEGTDLVLTVPSTVRDLPVTIIGDGSGPIQSVEYDANREELPEDQSYYVREISVSDGTRQIAANAFEYMNLMKIDLPDTLEVIGAEAISMEGGSELPRIPDSVRVLGEGFMESYAEGEFIIPASLTYADGQMFSSLKNITNFVLDEDNENFTVQDGGLYSKDGTTLIAFPGGYKGNEDGEWETPDTLTKIGDYAFYRSYDLRSIELPEGIKEIGEKAFNGCSGLTSVVLPEKLESIDYGAFQFCDSLEDINFPDGLRSIGDYAFYSCEGLTEVSLPDTLIVIGSNAFGDCPNLHIEKLPDSLAVIGDYAFSTSVDPSVPESSGDTGFVLRIGPNMRSIGREALTLLMVTSFEVDEENPYYSSVEGFLTDVSGTVLISCPSGLQGTVKIPDSIVRIADNAFKDSKLMTDVYIPDSVGHISSSAFDPTYVTETITNEDGTTQEVSENRYLMTIHCSEGSYAQSYAMERNIPYVIE